MSVYDEIGTTYAVTRRADPRVAAQVFAATAGTVLNVGAGSGSYEPPSTVLAIEPSIVMIRQRPATAAPVVRARAEALPVRDQAVETVMALLTVHHWSDLEAGVAELRRVARRRIVVLTWDAIVARQFWLLRDYVPEAADFDESRAVAIDRLIELLGVTTVAPVLVPADCTDGFGAAFWCRPERYLDPLIRAGMSMLAQPGESVIGPGIEKLRSDLASGRWHARNGELAEADSFDAGYRLLVADIEAHQSAQASGPE